MLKNNALVVVADGHQAILFRNIGKHEIELKEFERIAPHSPLDESQGRQPRETRDEDEAIFAKQLAERLNQMVLTNHVEELAIIADPSTLGNLRKHYHKMLEEKLVKELHKTLTSAPTEDIVAALRD